MENKSQTIVLSLKYVLLAILTGVLVGIIDTVFGRGLLTISVKYHIFRAMSIKNILHYNFIVIQYCSNVSFMIYLQKFI